MDLVDKIIAYETGELGAVEMLKLFQGLIDDGSAWTLQGSYGRMAMSLIEDGFCHRGDRAFEAPAENIFLDIVDAVVCAADTNDERLSLFIDACVEAHNIKPDISLFGEVSRGVGLHYSREAAQ